ncbi:MAG TPA: N-acetylglucosamine-6-phosphate deacetylase [Planctomycetes bacterium]|nr:N-acetylglucosamine-6-phosphate deacetylase [Planctomycetota bacterium]
MKELRARTLATPERILCGARIQWEEDRIQTLEPVEPEEGQEELVLPGMIDLQVNGFAGIDLMGANEEEFREMARALLRRGVVGFLPTFISAPIPKLCERLETLGSALSHWPREAARVLGFHVEGPFLNPLRRGTHPREHLARPDRGALREILAAGKGRVRLLTLAPELPGALDLVTLAREQGVLVSMGHSAASFDEARRGADAGIQLATHLGNAMPELRQRSPGIVGFCLSDPRITATLIPDGIHLAPGFLRLVLAAKGSGGIILVTDAMAGAGMGDGTFKLGSIKVSVSRGACRNEEGALAGSALEMDRGLDLFARETGAGPSALAQVSAGNAMRLLGMEKKALEPGSLADLCLWKNQGEKLRLGGLVKEGCRVL